MHSQLILPFFVMLILPFLVLVKMFLSRASEMKSKRIHPQKVATRTQMSSFNISINTSDNFLNLFEMPVLFYALTLLYIFLGLENTLLIYLAWIFVIARYTHSLIHTTTNKVMHRFYAFTISVISLFIYLVVGFLKFI
jgi:hypothetical protein